MNRYSNTAFIPYTTATEPAFNIGGAMPTHQDTLSASVTLTPETHTQDATRSRRDYFTGIYNWANAHRDPACAAEAKRIFGDNLCPVNQDEAALYLGQSLLDATGYTQDPAGYYRAIGKELPTGYADYATLLRRIGSDFIKDQQSLYDDHQKALEVARTQLANLPEDLASSIYKSGALGADAAFAASALTPESLERISKFYDKDKAVESHQRALTAWTSFSGFMRDVDGLQTMNRETLRDIAAILQDKDGKPDPLATAVLSLLVERRATAMQQENPEAWDIFADSLQNWAARWKDQDAKDKASKWNTMVENWAAAGIDQSTINHFADRRYNNQAVEQLYGTLQNAMNTAMSPSEKADWKARTIASAARMVGESIVPTLASLGITYASRGAGFGTAASALGAYATNVAINSNSLINAAIADAYHTGKVNPEIHGRIQGSAQAATEGVFDAGTSLPIVGKLVGKASNKIAATAAGSRFLTNVYGRATLNYFTSGAIQGFGELAEEELGAYLESSINTLARNHGIQLSPVQYKFGETLGSMKSHEIAAIFGYSYTMGLLGFPANLRTARETAANTDALLAAGHSPAAVRDIQEHLFNTADKIAEVNADSSLTAEQKKQQVDKLNKDFFTYQKRKAQSDIWDADPEEVRQRLQKENKKTLEKAELALAIQADIDKRIAQKFGIIDTTAQPGDKFAVTLMEKGEPQEDGKEAPAKLVTQEWTRNQLTNFFQIQKADLFMDATRAFQGVVQAHAAAQTITNIDDLKIEFQNLRDTPLEAYAELQKHHGITENFIAALTRYSNIDIQKAVDSGLTIAEARSLPSPILKGVTLGEAANLKADALIRKEQEQATDSGLVAPDARNIEYGAFNITRADGSVLIAYANSRADTNDILEELLEAYIKHQLNSNPDITEAHLAAFLTEVDKHLPGKSILPKNKKPGEYTRSDLVEAYSRLALASYIYQEAHLPLSPGGHQLLQNIGKILDTAHVFKTIGDAWHTYANSPEGKAHLANGGKQLADILRESGFKVGSLVAQAKATAQQQIETIEAANWQPDIEAELDALLEEAEAEEQLAEINEQEAKEPITIPADQSITGQEITIEPQQEEPIVNSQSSIVNPLLSLIQQGKAKTQDFARFFRDNPAITDAQATELGIRPLTQKGTPTAAYTQGRLIAAKLTPQQFDDYINGKLKGKALKQALSKHGTSVPTTATFSIKPAADNLYDRFTVDPLGERIIHHIRSESRRYARLLGDKTPYEQAVNAAQSAASIISAVDKFLYTPGKPVPARYRRQLQKLRSIAEKYAQIIASGTPRSFKKISPQEKQELEAAIAELEAQELEAATTESDQLLTDSDRLTKREAAARAREHHRAIVRSAAKGRVYQTLSSMLDTTADALDSYLKHQLLQKLDRLTATVKIKRSPSKRLKGKMTAPAYRELERAINNMALSDRAYQDEIENVITAHETLARAINESRDNLTSGNALLIQLAQEITASGQQVTPQTLTTALANHEAALKIYGNVSSKNYEQTRLMANALFYLIRNGRNQWKDRHEAREARIQTYLRYFLAHTTPESETANAKRNKNESLKWKDALSLDITMNAAQTIMALSSYEALRPLMQDLLANYSTAAVARQKHLEEIRKQELYAFGRIIGATPSTDAGYTDTELKELSDKLDSFYAENNKTVETTITPTRLVRNADGELEHSTSAPLKLTKWEALNLILTYRQEHYQPNAAEHGFTPEVIDQLTNFIGQKMMDFGNAMQKILVNDGTITVYEEREGIPMRPNPLYWPGHININTINTTRDEPLVNPYHPAASHDFLHARVRNRQEVANRNAFGVFRKAIADRANYIYADPVTETITSLLARDQFANRLETLIGGNLKRQLQTVIREIKGAAWQETSLQDATSGIISAAFGAKSLAVLSGNPSSLIRQLSAAANAGLMPGISPQQYLAYAIKAKQNQSHISFTDILKLDAFTTRKRDNAYVNEMIAMGADATFSTLMNWAKAGINAMDKLDLYANAFSATVIYNIKYDQLKAQGNLTEEQIRKRCEQEVAIYTKLLAQPLNRVDKSALYWMIGNHAIGRSILFMGSEAINKVGMLRANYIMYRNQGNNPAVAAGKILGKMGITVGLAAAVNEAILALLTGRTPDDDDSQLAFYIALWLNASLGQYLSTIPLLGGVTDIAFSPYGGYFGGETVLPGSQLFTRDIGKLHTMLTDDKEYSGQQWNKEINRFMRNFTTILGYAGGANSKWQIYSSFAAFCQSLTAALNAQGFVFNAASNLTGSADEKPRRAKSKIEKWLTPDTSEEKPRRRTTRATRARRTREKEDE